MNNYWSILWFLRARDFNLQKTWELLKTSLDYLDKLDVYWLEQVTFDSKDLKESLARGFYNTDIHGHPIMIERIGHNKLKELFKKYSID